MHETRNFILVIALIAALLWALLAWLLLDPDTGRMVLAQRILAPALVLAIGAWLFYALVFEDHLPDYLKEKVGPVYYEADGLSFLPMVRVKKNVAELCVYYQNRYENPVEAVVHLRLPEVAFIVHEELRDVNFAFRCAGGDFGVIEQPIAVPKHLQGQVVTALLAATTHYPRSHGACWRRKPGVACGSLPADWSGGAFQSGVHEASSEMELSDPIELRLAMPTDVADAFDTAPPWRQQRLAAGAVAK